MSESNIVKLRYRLSEAADALSVSLSQVENLIKAGSLVVHQDQPGGHRYVSTTSLMNYIREREEQPVVGRRRAS